MRKVEMVFCLAMVPMLQGGCITKALWEPYQTDVRQGGAKEHSATLSRAGKNGMGASKGGASSAEAPWYVYTLTPLTVIADVTIFAVALTGWIAIPLLL